MALPSQSQNSLNNVEGYSDIEIKTERCLDEWIQSAGTNRELLQNTFESYFATSGITKASDPKHKQYEDILKFWNRPQMSFPPFSDKKIILKMKNDLGIDDQGLSKKIQLDCFTNTFIANKASIDTTLSYYTFGSVLEAIKEIPDISPGLIAGALLTSMDKDDLKKPLYQKTIALMFCFDMAVFLPDEYKK
jgi:hypothetical protein